MRRSTTPTSAARRRAWITRIAVLVACAVAPWLIPWSGTRAAEVDEQPAATVHSAAPSAVPRTGAAPTSPGPDANSVRGLLEATRTQAVNGYDLPVSGNDVSSVSTRPGPYRELGRLEIPAIGLNVKYGEGVFAKTLEKGPGHWPGTPMPGSLGNAVLSGHRNTHTQPFKELDMLRPGDRIIASSSGAPRSVTYAVRKTTIVPEAKFKDFVLRQPTDDQVRELTLFACHPEGNPVYRIVVQARAQG